jgi:hypothetical protein
MKRLIKALFTLVIVSIIVSVIPFGKVIIVAVFIALMIRELGIVKITINKP